MDRICCEGDERGGGRWRGGREEEGGGISSGRFVGRGIMFVINNKITILILTTTSTTITNNRASQPSFMVSLPRIYPLCTRNAPNSRQKLPVFKLSFISLTPFPSLPISSPFFVSSPLPSPSPPLPLPQRNHNHQSSRKIPPHRPRFAFKICQYCSSSDICS